MSPILVVCLILSFSLAVTSLMVIQLRRQRRGLKALLARLVNREFYHAETDVSGEPDPANRNDHRLEPSSIAGGRMQAIRPRSE